MSPLHLLCISFGSMDFGLFGNLIQRYLALYEVRIPWGGDLPPTSFRHPRHRGCPCLKLTATTAFAAQDLNLIGYAHAGHTTKKGTAGLAVPLRGIILIEAFLSGNLFHSILVLLGFPGSRFPS